MAEELDELLNEDKGKVNADDPAKKPDDRSQVRFTQLVDKVKEQSQRAESAEERAFQAEFRADFRDQTDKYPLAKEHEDEIRQTVKNNNLSVADATALVLQRQGKLTTREELDKNKAADESRGGSAATGQLPASGKKDPKDMTQAERLAELNSLEQSGDLSLS